MRVRRESIENEYTRNCCAQERLLVGFSVRIRFYEFQQIQRL